jgi:hypothetical protein
LIRRSEALQQKMSTYTPEQMHERAELHKVWVYLHAHGRGLRQESAVRLVVARFDDQLPDLPFRRRRNGRIMAADFQQMSDYFRTRNVRVVNLSWETIRKKSSCGSRRAGRRSSGTQARAAEITRSGTCGRDCDGRRSNLCSSARRSTDSDASFLQDVPAGLHLPNLISVGQ